MRRAGVFWGIVLIVVGGLFLLDTLDIVQVRVGRLIFPVFLLLVGVWLLLGTFGGGRFVPGESSELAIPLEGAGRARVVVKHGASRLTVRGGAGPGQLLSGTFGPGMDYRTRRDGDALDVELTGGGRWWPGFMAPWTWAEAGALDWQMALSGEVPLELSLETGASETRLDLTDLRVTDLRVQTGASSTSVALPARAGHTRARISAGMASVSLRVPEGVAARIRSEGALAGVKVDEARFPRSGGVYESPDWATAENKVEIHAETGMGSLEVR